MSFNGSGTFVRTNGVNTGSALWAADRDAGTKILAARHDTHDQNLADGLSTCITKDGQTTRTANSPMSGFKHTNVATASARTEYARASQVQDSSLIYGGTAGGTANALTISLTPALTAYATGMIIAFKALSNNTGAATLNVNGVGAAAIQTQTGAALTGAEIAAGSIFVVIYDGTNFRLLGGQSTRAQLGLDLYAALADGSHAITERYVADAAGTSIDVRIGLPVAFLATHYVIGLVKAKTGGTLTLGIRKNGTQQTTITVTDVNTLTGAISPILYSAGDTISYDSTMTSATFTSGSTTLTMFLYGIFLG